MVYLCYPNPLETALPCWLAMVGKCVSVSGVVVSCGGRWEGNEVESSKRKATRVPFREALLLLLCHRQEQNTTRQWQQQTVTVQHNHLLLSLLQYLLFPRSLPI